MQLQVDGKSKGFFNLEQLLTLLGEFEFKQDTEEEIIEAFRELDHDGDGYIPSEEFGKYLSQMGEGFNSEEIKEFMTYALVNLKVEYD